MALKLTDMKDDEALNEAVTKLVDKAIEGLKKKTTEMGREKDKLKEKLDALGELTPDKIKELEAAAEALKEKEAKDLEAKGEYEKLIGKMRDDHKAELKKAKDEAKTNKEALHHELKIGGLTKELAEKGVPKLINAAVKLLADDVALVEVEGKLVARVGDKDLSAYIDEWGATDEGKVFIKAKNGKGGGAGGDVNKGGDNEGKAEDFFNPESPNYNLTKAATWMKENDANGKAGKGYMSKYLGSMTDATTE